MVLINQDMFSYSCISRLIFNIVKLYLNWATTTRTIYASTPTYQPPSKALKCTTVTASWEPVRVQDDGLGARNCTRVELLFHDSTNYFYPFYKYGRSVDDTIQKKITQFTRFPLVLVN